MSQTYQPGETMRGLFGLSDATGAAIWVPAGVLVLRNNTIDPTVTASMGTPIIGQQTYSFTIPSTYNYGDTVSVVGTAVISAINQTFPVNQVRLDTTQRNLFVLAGGLYGTPVSLGTTDRATLTTLQASINQQGGTPSLIYGLAQSNATAVGALQASVNTVQASVNAVGGTPAINRGLLSTLQTSVNAVGGTPANLISGGQFTTFALANAPAGGGGGTNYITQADAASLRTAAAIIGGTNTNPANRTYQYPQSDGKTVTVVVGADNQTQTVTVV